MPTYDYECSDCGHRWELFQSITAKPKRKCPECGRGTARRLIGRGGGIIFKGSGFYQTDYRSESYRKAAKAETDSCTTAKDKGKDKSAETKKSDSKNVSAA